MNLRLRNRCKRCGAFLSVEEPPVRPNFPSTTGAFWSGAVLTAIVFAAWLYFR